MSFDQAVEYAPDLWLERSVFAGMILGASAYGIHCCIFSATVYHLHNVKRANKMDTLNHFVLWTMFVLGTFKIAGAAKFLQQMWIDERGIEGGPSAWFTQHFGDSINTLSSASGPPSIFLQNAILLYRMFVIYEGNYMAIVLPFLGLIASTVLSVLAEIQSVKPGNGLWSLSTVSLAVPYCSVSVGINIAMTLAIAGRMLYWRWVIAKRLDPVYAKTYSSAAAMVIESGASYSALGLIFIVSFARGSNVQNLVYQALGQSVCFSTELIILRAALGRAWTRNASIPLASTIKFASGDQHKSRGQGTTCDLESISPCQTIPSGLGLDGCAEEGKGFSQGGVFVVKQTTLP